MEENDNDDVDADDDCSKFVDFHEDYDGTSPKPNATSDYACSSSTLVVQQDDSRNCAFRSKVNVEGLTNQNDECTNCDWNNLISDASDLQLIFESPDCTDPFKKSVESDTSFFNNIANDVSNVQSFDDVGSGELAVEGSEPENVCTQPGDGNEVEDAGHSLTNPDEKVDFEVKIAKF